jgi:hypothetical protein
MNTKSTFDSPIPFAQDIWRRMFGLFKVFLLLFCAIESASSAEPGRVTELMTKAGFFGESIVETANGPVVVMLFS